MKFQVKAIENRQQSCSKSGNSCSLTIQGRFSNSSRCRDYDWYFFDSWWNAINWCSSILIIYFIGGGIVGSCWLSHPQEANPKAVQTTSNPLGFCWSASTIQWHCKSITSLFMKNSPNLGPSLKFSSSKKDKWPSCSWSSQKNNSPSRYSLCNNRPKWHWMAVGYLEPYVKWISITRISPMLT